MSLLFQEGGRKKTRGQNNEARKLARKQGYNPAEKTRMREIPKVNPGRQPCKENKKGRKP
jgi:hypothetical protein